MKREKRLVTVALPYTNNIPHLGNIVGSHLPGDIFARYCRLVGHNAILIGGTDEHGTPITVEAQKYGVKPKELCDKFYKIHREIYDWLKISYNNFSRTSKSIHHETTKEFFLKLYKNKYLTEKKVKIPFCEGCDQSLPDRFIYGTCPYCGYEKARGDQCENCSNLLNPIELKNPRCAICDSEKVKFLEKKHLFFRLDKLSKRLEIWIKKNKTWRENVKSIALSWIKEGLKPRDITRDIDWGVKIPIKGYEDSVVYVWGEAAIGYISSTKEWDKTKWKDYWKDKKAKLYQFIGKDNIPFHTLLFPAELISVKDNYNLPYNVVGLQYLNYERGKFSKSQRRGVFCENLRNAGLGPDYWRFYLTFIIPETKDTEFLWKDFQERINSGLIGNLSNFINRTLIFIYKNFDGKIPSYTIKDKKIQREILNKINNIISLFEKVELRLALEEILKLSDLGNKYFQNKEPWKTKDKEVLFICGNLCKILALLIQPYLPDTSLKILNMLNCKEKDWKKIKKFNLKNHKIKKPKILFKRLESRQIKELKEKTSQVSDLFGKKIEPPSGLVKLKEELTFEDFDFRVGEIKGVKDHPKADKLYVIKVDLGKLNADDLQIVSGLKAWYKKEDLIGKKIIILRNLKEAIIRDMESQGMLLAAVDGKKLALLTADKSRNGARVFIDLREKAKEEVTIEDFMKVKLFTKDGKIIYNKKFLRTEKEKIGLDKKMKNGVRIE